MAFLKKTWKDRVSEQPQRRLLTPTDGGTSYTVDVTRQEGIVVEEGDAFSAANMNDLETRIKNTFDSDESTLNTVNTKANTNASNISTLQTNVNNLSSQKAPNNHASTGQTYGVGSTSAFGHLKINDSYTSSSGAASQGVAASSKAVYDAYRNRAPVNHASSDTTYGRGNASQYGHVKLSDSFARNDGGAADGVGASSQALSGVYNTLVSNVSSLDSRITGNTTSIGNIMGELTANGNRIYMDYKNGKYGYNTSANRGADTFHPFSSIDNGTLEILTPGDTYTVNLGFRPARVWAYINLSASGQYHTIIYDPVISTTTYIWMGGRPSGPADFWIDVSKPLGEMSTLGIFNITDNGFTVNMNYYGGTLYYCASST